MSSVTQDVMATTLQRHSTAAFDFARECNVFDYQAWCRGLRATAFLEYLQATYRGLGIGGDLDFAQVAAFWQGTAPLSAPWRRALAQAYPRERVAGYSHEVESARQMACLHLFESALQAVPPEDWMETGERCVVLFAPFTSPAELCHWLLPTPYSGALRVDERVWLDGQLAAMQEWAQSLSTAEQWQDVRHWLAAAGAAPVGLHEALSRAGDPWSRDDIDGLVRLRLLLLLVREQLQRDQVPDAEWVALLLRCCPLLADNKPQRLGQALFAIRNQYCLPLLQVLARQPRLPEMLAEVTEQDRLDGYWRARVAILFQRLGLGLLLAESLADFAMLLERVDDQTLARMGWPDGMAERAPAAALLRQQALFARGSHFDAEVTTPKALVWYREVLESLDKGGETYESCIQQLANCLSDDELDALIQLQFVQHGTAGNKLPVGVLAGMDNSRYLRAYLSCYCEALQQQAADRLFRLASARVDTPGSLDTFPYALESDGWQVLLEVSERYPGLFIQQLSYASLYNGQDRLERWQLLWDSTDDPQGRTRVVSACFDALRDDLLTPVYLRIHGMPLTAPANAELRAEVFCFLENCYREDAAPFRLFVAHMASTEVLECMEVLREGDSQLRALLLWMVGKYFEHGSNAIRVLKAFGLNKALAAHPNLYAELEPKVQIKLLPLFDDGALMACAASLSVLFACQEKALATPATSLIARCSPDAIEQSGLLLAPPQARTYVLIGMALSPKPEMNLLIARHFHDSAHNEASRDLSLDALERTGHALEGFDPWAAMDLLGLQAIAKQQPEVKAAVKTVWNDSFAALLAPLGEPLSLYLLAIVHEHEPLSRRARRILMLLPTARRADFALLAAERWIAENGANEYAWLTRPLDAYGDERAAQALQQAVQDWKKTRTQKAALAINLLCRLPGTFGAFQAHELLETGKLTASIKESAWAGLGTAAERHGMSLEDFSAVLVPDFGLGSNNLQLDVGPSCYSVRLGADLSLQVFDAAGKIYKSLPKIRAGDDPDKYELVARQFKALAKNLKPLLKLLSARLERAFQLGRGWPARSWLKLYSEHPLLRLSAQSVVWSAEDEQGQPLKRFRPSDSGELIDLNDEPFSLTDAMQVHVTHPLELDEAEQQAWRTHLDDYQMVSLFDQLNTAVYRPTAEQLASGEQRMPSMDCVIPRHRFATLLDKWGYVKGERVDGGEVMNHHWLLDSDGWQVTIEHAALPVGYFDPEEPVRIERLVVKQRLGEILKAQRLIDLPPAFANTLLAQINALQEGARV